MSAPSGAVVIEPPRPEPVPAPRSSRLSGAVARLTLVNALGAATGLITGPILARALGASGRGDLAAIVVPLSLAPAILSLGIPAYAFLELPKGRAVNEVVGSLALPLVVIGAVTAAFAVPVADALAGGRETVRLFLLIGLLLTPLALVGNLFGACLAALERWRLVAVFRLIPFATPFVALVALYATGRLTVTSASVVTIAGATLSLLAGLPLLERRPVFRPPLFRASLRFGLKSWLGGLALLANVRLDQFLMIPLVPSRELGLYAVAYTLSGASNLATGAVQPPLMARIGAGDTYLLPDVVRVTLASTLTLNFALAVVTPLLLPLVFGAEFRDAVPMALILLAANVSFAGATVLSGALQADGVPLVPSIAEGGALVLTVVGLLALLPSLGGVGAALVSLAAYSASFVFQLVVARRRIPGALRAYLVPSPTDLRWAAGRMKHILGA